MKSRPVTFYMPPDVADIIHRGNGRNASASLAKKLRRYEVIVAQSIPAFTALETAFLKTVLEGYPVDLPNQLRGIGGLLRTWKPRLDAQRPSGVDPSSMGYRIDALSFAQLVALVEAIEVGADAENLSAAADPESSA